MNTELELLIKLHDLDIMIRDATEERYANEERDMGFVLRNLTSLQQAHDKLREQVSPETLRHYDRLFAKYGRSIAPVNDGVCYGCFMQLPTLFVQESKQNEGLEVCPKCRKYLYWL
jgi:predicted  nucleic acid-binding Zn-ribbon protein